MSKKQHKEFVKLIERYGLSVERIGKDGHFAVVKDGRRVGTLSSSGEKNSYRQAIRDLWRQDLVPTEAKRVTF